jgi:hypothetical protein
MAEQDSRPMGLERAPSTNGRAAHDAPGGERDARRDVPAQAVAQARGTIAGRQRRVRPVRLILPAMLALGVIFILRRFEQDTAS